MRRLLLDIETAPNLVHCWGLWDQNIGISQIIAPGYVLCWAAKWVGQNKIEFDSLNKSKPKAMLSRVHSLLQEADAVIHYNGTKFDVPTLNKEFVLYGLTPPAPYKQIDLLRTVRQQFRFPSNKLDYVVQQLGLGKKYGHEGHELWIKCMAGDAAAWKVMEKYNKHDIVLLENLYDHLTPWIKGHTNMGLYQSNERVCPTCGSPHFHRRGVAHTATNAYPRFKCMDCSTWFRGAFINREDNEQKFRAIAG